MAYSNPTPPIWVPDPSANDITGGKIKPGPMPPTTRPPVPAPSVDMEARLAEILRRRAALNQLQPILGGGRGVPKNDLPAPTTRGERGGGKLMDGRGTLSEMPIRMPEGGWPRGPGRYEAMPMPAQITPEMVQRWWNGGGQYGNPWAGGIIGAGLGRSAGDRGTGLPPPSMSFDEGDSGFQPRPSPPPPMQAMLPDQGVNQAPQRQRPQRPQRPQGPYEFTNVDDINNRYGVDASNWYGDDGLTDYGRQGFAQILAERFGQVGNVNDINSRFGVDANGWYGDDGAITDQGRQGWLQYMMSMNPYYGGF